MAPRHRSTQDAVADAAARSDVRAAAGARSSGYMVFGFTATRPPVSEPTRSMSWLP